MEIIEHTIPNDAGIAKRALERMMNQKIEVIEEAFMEAGLDRSNMCQIEDAIETLSLLHSLNNDPLEEELKPKGWTAVQEAANADGFLFSEYHEYDL
jgi:hypothetical protein